MHYTELGRIYAQMGRKEEARKYIHKGMAMPDKEKDDPEMKEIGKQILQKLDDEAAATALRCLQRCFGGGPLRHICQATAHELGVPKLGGDDCSEAHFHGESRQRSGPHFTKAFAPARHFADIKVTGAAANLHLKAARDENRPNAYSRRS